MSKQTLKPTFANVIIRPIEAVNKTPGGIVLPEDNNQDRPQIGTVLEIGPGRKNESGKLMPMVVKPGQKVAYKKWGGVTVEFEGEKLVMIDQKEILAILE